jgi:HlyD family secretion protein
VEEGKDKFVGGMSADVIIIVNEKDGVLFIPSDAIIRDQYAYVVERGRAVRREVTIGIGNWERTEIVEGIQEGEQYITSVALQELADGVRIKVVEDLG